MKHSPTAPARGVHWEEKHPDGVPLCKPPNSQSREPGLGDGHELDPLPLPLSKFTCKFTPGQSLAASTGVQEFDDSPF